jgi:hypothetical protein
LVFGSGSERDKKGSAVQEWLEQPQHVTRESNWPVGRGERVRREQVRACKCVREGVHAQIRKVRTARKVRTGG